jgi:hypothetical protein
MSNANTLQIRIEVNDQGSKKIKALGGEVRKVGDEGERGFGRMRRSLNDFDQSGNVTLGTITKMTAGLAALGAAASVAMAALAAKAVKAASDLAEVQSKFNVVFAGQTGVAEAWSRELVASYAMSTREAKQYLSSVQDLLVPMGMAADQAGVMSNEVVKLAADLGSFNNLPTAQVMDDIQSALVGNYETMKKYGVVLNATTVEQQAMSMGLAKTKAELTAADKAQAAYALMIEGSTAALGDMIRTQDGYANQAKKFQAQIEDLTAAFGKYLLPIAADALKQINIALGDGTDSVDTLAAALTIKLLSALGWVLEGMRFFHNAWLAIKIVGQASITAIAVGLERLFVGMRTLMIGFDKMMDGLVMIGAIDVNPFDTMEAAMADFSWSAKQQLSDVAGEIDATNAKYDQIADTIDGMVEKTEQSAEANRKAGEETAALEKELAAVGTTAGDTTTALGGLTTETDKNGKTVTAAADAWQRYQVQMTRADGWLLRDRGMVKANERAEEMIATLSDLDALVSDSSFYDIADTIEAETEKATDTSAKLWEDFVGNTGDIIHNFVNDVVRGEFDSIEDLFGGMLDSMLSMLLDFISKAAANSLIDVIFGEGASGENSLKLGSLLGGLFDGESGSGSGSGGGSGGYSLPTGGMGEGAKAWIAKNVSEQAASYFSTAAGAVGVAGGAYGMYSGIKDMGDGKIGQGAVKTGLGAYSTYKGGVTLGIIEEGTATKIGQSVVQGLSSYIGGSSSAYSAGGAMMHMGGSVAEGGALAASGASSAGAGGGGAAGAGAAGGGLSLASVGVGGIYATAAMIAFKLAMGNPQSQAQIKRDQLNAGGTTPGDIVGAGATDQLAMFSKALRTDVTPALTDATVGSYNAGSGLLVLGKRTEEFVRTGADGQGKLVDAMTYDTWRWDELAGAWKTVNSPIDGLVDKLRQLAPATDTAAASAANMLAAQAGYPDLADEVLTIYNDQKAGLVQLSGEHQRFGGLLGAATARMSDASGTAWSLAESLSGSASASASAAGAEDRRRGLLLGAADAISSATANMNSQKAATEALAASSGAAAGRISQAAGDIGGAVNRIGGLLGRAASFSDPRFQGNAAGAIYSYHALGGVMTKPTVFHVGGEAGDEAIVPLHNGPDSFRKLDEKVDRLLAGRGGDDEMKAILAAIAAYSKKTSDILRRFEYTGIPESQRQAVTA